MKCKKCGAPLLDTDKFCSQCGWKVVKERRCPECGAALREGTKFCSKCGVLIGNGESEKETAYIKNAEASDIPIGDIEQNILSETERELHTGKKKHPPVSESQKKRPAASAPKKSVPAPEPKKKKKPAPAPVKKKVYEEWDDEDDEDDEDDDGSNFMVIMTVAMALLIIAIAAALVFYTLKTRDAAEDGTSVEAEQGNEADDVEAGNDAEAENGGEMEPEEDNAVEIEEANPAQPVGTLSIVSNVNVRDNPSKTGTNIIKVAQAGETYEYMGTAEDGNWYMILLEDGSIGYVFEEYVSVD